jgi:hypothetical protein
VARADDPRREARHETAGDEVGQRRRQVAVGDHAVRGRGCRGLGRLHRRHATWQTIADGGQPQAARRGAVEIALERAVHRDPGHVAIGRPRPHADSEDQYRDDAAQQSSHSRPIVKGTVTKKCLRDSPDYKLAERLARGTAWPC